MKSFEEQIDECHRLAKSDIDSIPDMIKEIENKIKRLKEISKCH